MNLPRQFVSYIQKELSAWERLYRKDMHDCGFLPLHWAYVDEELKGEEKKEALAAAEEDLQAQIDFIKMMVSFEMLSGDTPENRLRIKTFIINQHCKKERLPGRKWPVFHLTFWGGCVGSQAVMASMNELREFDFADAWSDIRFNIVCIANFSWRTWTKERIAEVAKHIKDDFAFDGYTAKIRCDSGKAGEPGRSEICFECKVQ